MAATQFPDCTKVLIRYRLTFRESQPAASIFQGDPNLDDLRLRDVTIDTFSKDLSPERIGFLQS
jgi:hypothetical protein